MKMEVWHKTKNNKKKQKNEKNEKNEKNKKETGVKLTQQKLELKPNGGVAVKRPNTSPLHPPTTKFVDRKVTPTNTPQSAAMQRYTDESSSAWSVEDDEDFVPENEWNRWKTVLPRRRKYKDFY